MTYGDFKDLTWKNASDKILREKAFNITKNSKYDGCQRGLASVIYKFLIKKIQTEQLKLKIFLINSNLKNYTNQLLKTLRRERYTHQT